MLATLWHRQASANELQQDVRAFMATLNAHVSPFELRTRSELESLAAIAEKYAAFDLTRGALAFQQLAGAVGDLHTSIQTPELLVRRLPFKLTEFAEGWFVTAVARGAEFWLGRRVLSLGGLAPEAIRDAARRFAGYPLAAEFEALFDASLGASAAVLFSLGIGSQNNVDVISSAGLNKALRTSIVAYGDAAPTLTEVDFGMRPALPFEQLPQRHYVLAQRPADQSLTIHYRRCVADPELSVSAFVAQVRAAVRAVGARRAVIDFRGNGGGDSSLFFPVYQALLETSALAVPRALRVITHARTQSSAMLNAYSLREEVRAIVVGEVAGTSLNHFGEVRQALLPSGRRMTYSTRRFFLAPGDPRGRAAGLDPDLPVRPSWVAIQSGIDQVLEAAIAAV